MTDTPPETDGAAEPELRSARRSLLSRVSIVWIVPILALLVSLGVVWQRYADRGPIIQIAFEDAAGIRADETQLRYRDVVVGLVEAVHFSQDLERVLVDVRVDKEVAPFIDSEAEFWVVTPQVSAQGVTGLNTILSGVFIEGNWDSVADEAKREFTALRSAPLIRYGQEGLTVRLRSASVDGLSEGTPILYRGIEVGQIANLRLSDDGVSVEADAFISAPESRLINSATRFWDTSGFNFRFGAQGAELNVASIASLVTGGVTFDTTVSGGEAVDQNAVFRLYDSEDAARASVYANNADSDPVTLAILFDQTVPGLEVGDEVEFGGIRVGQVEALTGVMDEEQFGDRQVRLQVLIQVDPARMGLEDDSEDIDVIDFFDFAVRNGLRAQLQTASILGGLQVALVQINDAPDASFDRNAEPYPRIPSIEPDISDFADTAEGVFNRVNNLPIEELLNGAIDVMASVNSILNDEGVTETPREVLSLLGDVRNLVGSEDVQALPGQAGEIMASLQSTAGQLEAVVVELTEAGAVQSLVAALDAAETAANSVYEAVDEVPETLDGIDTAIVSLDELITTVNRLPLESVVDEAEGSIAALRTLLAAPATQGLTGDVSSVLGQVEGLVDDVRSSGLVADADAAINDIRQIAADFSQALTPLLADARAFMSSAQDAADGVPDAVAQLEMLLESTNALVTDIDALPLDQVLDNVNTVLTGVDQFLLLEGTQSLPAEVNDTLRQVRSLLENVEDSGVIAQATGTLEATESAVRDIRGALEPVLSEAQRAAAAVAEAADDVPAITERAQEIADRIDELVTEAASLPLEELAARASALLDSANTLVASEDTRALPADLSAALGEVERLLIQVQEGGLIANANATLAAAESAAGAIAEASSGLPDIVDRLNAILAEAEGAVSGYQVNGAFGSEARSTLRDIREAAQAVDALARQIERSPNSLLFGR
ncbi:paraquat-inducible protein B [Palleronia aestuarii]|uniref:Paraquat-inducible protein B n=1 Tax=Palleronia aestuarii TaxID=568105 RepID=A0A2W7Q7R5_9RHOB|nr:MlaD family protein [Palleronia aestuarii]PZX17779.1 paraquat-inducible protein B [Palleronia aestuarii]